MSREALRVAQTRSRPRIHADLPVAFKVQLSQQIQCSLGHSCYRAYLPGLARAFLVIRGVSLSPPPTPLRLQQQWLLCSPRIAEEEEEEEGMGCPGGFGGVLGSRQPVIVASNCWETWVTARQIYVAMTLRRRRHRAAAGTEDKLT